MNISFRGVNNREKMDNITKTCQTSASFRLLFGRYGTP